MAALTYKKVVGTRRNKEVDQLEAFFEMNVLGIFATFNDYLKDIKGKLSTPEKIRIMRAIEEMMKMARGSVSSAVPQVRSDFYLSDILRNANQLPEDMCLLTRSIRIRTIES